MPIKPIHHYPSGKGPRQIIWEAIRRLAKSGAMFGDADIKLAAQETTSEIVSLVTVRAYRKCLVAAGILREVTPYSCKRVRAMYELAKDEGLDAPRLDSKGRRILRGLIQEQMWRTLRVIPVDINAVELSAHSSTKVAPVSVPIASMYLARLYRAGYLVKTQGGKRGGRYSEWARYRLPLQHITGPKSPVLCHTHVVYDPNKNEVVWSGTVTEEDAVYEK